MKFRFAFAAALFFWISHARAHEAIFAWTYTTDLTPKGHGEFEQWLTARWEKEHGDYSVIDFREEFEYGMTDNFQLALYLNYHYVYANDDVPAEDPKDPLGFALYFEPSVGDQETELEWKILLQKNWLEDRLVWALNINYELEFEKEDDGYERDGVFEWFTGISYRFMRNWSAGLEFWNHHEFADATVHEHSAYFVGPTIHYGGERWWATLGFLHQLPRLDCAAVTSNTPSLSHAKRCAAFNTRQVHGSTITVRRNASRLSREMSLAKS